MYLNSDTIVVNLLPHSAEMDLYKSNHKKTESRLKALEFNLFKNAANCTVHVAFGAVQLLVSSCNATLYHRFKNLEIHKDFEPRLLYPSNK